jgi:hypothetical protein
MTELYEYQIPGIFLIPVDMGKTVTGEIPEIPTEKKKPQVQYTHIISPLRPCLLLRYFYP